MAKKKKRSATRAPKSAQMRREDDVEVALSAPHSPASPHLKQSGLNSNTRISDSGSPSKFLPSANEEDMERVELEDCSEEGSDEEELDYEESEEFFQTGFKLPSSRATVHPPRKNFSELELAFHDDLGGQENLPVDVSQAKGGLVHGQSHALVDVELLDPSLAHGNAVNSSFFLSSGNASRGDGTAPVDDGAPLPSNGRKFASLGSSMGADGAGTSGTKLCTPPVCPIASNKSLTSGANREAPTDGQRDKHSNVPNHTEIPSTAGGSRPDIRGRPTVAGSAQWRDLFANNRSAESATKLTHYEAVTEQGSCILFDEDSNERFSNDCLVGFVAGKSPGFKALSAIITNVWKCQATLTIHESGWLVYRFQSEEDKLSVLNSGPYLIYGRPLMLKVMPRFFDFSEKEMSLVPVWVKLPNLPLECWSVVNLSKIASAVGRPIQCDKLTSSMARLSYARVLVEVDILKDLRESVKVQLPNGISLCQLVVYETLPSHCKHCKVLSHSSAACKSRTEGGVQQGTRRSVFSRLGPSLDSVEAAAEIMFPEVASGHEEWEVVRGKQKQKRKGVLRDNGGQTTRAETGARTAKAGVSNPPRRGSAETANTAPAAVAPPSGVGALAVDPAVICAEHTHLNTPALRVDDTAPNAPVLARTLATDSEMVVSGAATLHESVGTVGAEFATPEPASPQALNVIAAAPKFFATDPIITAAIDTAEAIPVSASTTVYVTGTAEEFDSHEPCSNVENEMRGGGMCQGSLGSPFAGAARLSDQEGCPPGKGLVRNRDAVLGTNDLAQIGDSAMHGNVASKGSDGSQVANKSQVHGMLTRSGKRRAKGGGKGIPSTGKA